jgi:dihydroorotase
MNYKWQIIIPERNDFMKHLQLIAGGIVLDPASQTEARLDILIKDDKIEGLYSPGTLAEEIYAEAEIYDAAKCYVAPGLIDLHVHLREPGGESNETIATGMQAAAAGGFTAICSMPNSPITADRPEIIEEIIRRSQAIGLVDVLPIAALTKGLAGEVLNDLPALINSGAAAISDDGMPITSSLYMQKALEFSSQYKVPIIDHCEDLLLKGQGLMHEGAVSKSLGLTGISAVSEAVPIARNILLAQATGGHIHIAHLSTKEGVSLLRYAKEQGIKATAEVMPHHLRLSDEALMGYSTMAKVSPPLRSQEHQKAVRQAIATGLITCLATDHAPWSLEAKNQAFEKAPNGISGLETALAVTWDTLVVQDKMKPIDLIARWTIGPAAVLNSKRGRLAPGSPADIVVIDPQLKKKVDPNTFYSMGHNTPFAGMTLQGWPVMTMHRGQIVMKSGQVIDPKKVTDSIKEV